MTRSLTRKMGEFVAGSHNLEIPQKAIEVARSGITDCIGVMIAGRMEEAPQILQQVLGPQNGNASLYFSGVRITALEAAWINGVAAHAHDYDDTGVRGHPSTVLVPAILAEAEELNLSGADMLAAYVIGYETWAELSLRERGSLHSKGWHPTGIWGAVASAAACAYLRRLDVQQATCAIALGASQSSGIVANFGTMAKPFHAGRAAYAGVLAARLAHAGFTASDDAFDHPQGLLRAVSQHGDTDLEREPLCGTAWHIEQEGLNIKKYPTCYCTHRAIDGMLDLRKRSQFSSDDVLEIRVAISDRYGDILRNHQPTTGLGAKFSMEFAMASCVVASHVGLTELTDEFVNRDDVQSLMRRVHLDFGTDYDPGNPNALSADRVTVKLKNGDVLDSGPVSRARGHADLPLNKNELFEKFELCLESAGVKSEASTLFDRLSVLESISARELTRPR